MSVIEDLSRVPRGPKESRVEVHEFLPQSTPLHVLRERGIQLVGVIPVVLHQGPDGTEVLVGVHKQTKYEPDGCIGLPRETTKWDEHMGKGEDVLETAWRCFYEELGGVDVRNIPFRLAPAEQNYLELEETLPGPFTAHAKTFVMWTPTTDWVPKHVLGTELHAAHFVSVEQIASPPQGARMREMTQNVLTSLFDRGMTHPPESVAPTYLLPPQNGYSVDFRYPSP